MPQQEPTSPTQDGPAGQSGQERVESRRPAEPTAPSRPLRSKIKRGIEVLAATAFVVGLPLAITWWLRASGMVTSLPLNVLIGVLASLLASGVGRRVWERLPGSEDLLFNELLLWGFIGRSLTQRRISDATALLGAIAGGNEVDAKPVDRVKLLGSLVESIETRDRYLHGHSRRVARYSWMIAKQLGLDDDTVAHVRTAAAIHDVGKIHVPRAVLHKPDRLTDEEFEIIKKHSPDGADMVAVLQDDVVTRMVRHHHERLDGTGYPDRLAGTDIPLGARIIAVADTFDAITSSRPYRAASAHKKALGILRGEAGTRLDADVVRAFCNHYAGRRQVAAWATLAEIPSRLLSLLGSNATSLTASLPSLAAVAAATAGTAMAAGTPKPAHPSPALVAQAPTPALSSSNPGDPLAVVASGGYPPASGRHRRLTPSSSTPAVEPPPIVPPTPEDPLQAGTSGIPEVPHTPTDRDEHTKAPETAASKPEEILPPETREELIPTPAPAEEAPPAKQEAPHESAKEEPAKEAPKEEPAKEAPKEEAPKEEAKEEAPKEAPKEEAKEEPAKEEAPKEEAPREEAKEEAPKEEAKEKAPEEEVKEEAPKEEAKEEAPKEEAKEKAPEEESKKGIIEEILEIII